MTERWKVDDQLVEIRRNAYQRTLRLRVLVDGTLRISCARTVGRREISKFLSESQKFIRSQMEELRRLREKFPAKRFIEGEIFSFLGMERRCEIRPDHRKPKVRIEAGRLIVTGKVESAREIQAAIRAFYRVCGRKYLAHRLKFLSELMHLHPSGVSFRSQRSRWGSCSGAGHISLNWRLIAAPAEVIDYVIIHELAHLQHHNHSAKFWRLVAEYSPQYKKLRRWLSDHQWSFDFLSV